MRTLAIGTSKLKTPRLAYGCWRLAGTWNPEEITPEGRAKGVRAAIAAFEAGYTLFDQADIYCSGEAEKILGQALKEVSGMRKKILIATKCGIRFAGDPRPDSPFRYDFSSENILSACEGSMKRMGVDVIDIYQLHRPDYLMDPDEVATAFTKLKKQGKVREFGVSNFKPSQLALLQKACPMRLIVQQVEISLLKLDCLNDGTLDQCLGEKIMPLAWSPLAGGLLGEEARIDFKDARLGKTLALHRELDALAKEYGVSRMVIALAWLLKHPAGIVPIVGSTKPERIREAVKADAIELKRDQWYRLLEAARGERLP